MTIKSELIIVVIDIILNFLVVSWLTTLKLVIFLTFVLFAIVIFSTTAFRLETFTIIDNSWILFLLDPFLLLFVGSQWDVGSRVIYLILVCSDGRIRSVFVMALIDRIQLRLFIGLVCGLTGLVCVQLISSILWQLVILIYVFFVLPVIR